MHACKISLSSQFLKQNDRMHVFIVSIRALFTVEELYVCLRARTCVWGGGARVRACVGLRGGARVRRCVGLGCARMLIFDNKTIIRFVEIFLSTWVSSLSKSNIE